MPTKADIPRRPGLTLIEVLVGCACVAVLLVLALLALGQAPSTARQVKDSRQIASVHQGFVLWQQCGSPGYPLPSNMDGGNYTVFEQEKHAKNTTANIYSLLIFENFFSPEILVSPAEQSSNITIDTDYRLTSPPTAVDPSLARWDPAFNADFSGNKNGNTSYAHTVPTNKTRWENSLQSNEAILGNRGPEITTVQTTASFSGSITPTPQFANPNSITNQIHGHRASWEGNIAFNDNHVEFFKNVYSTAATYEAAAFTPKSKKRQIPDVFFFDEPDAVNNDNSYLGIFTKAGPTTKDFNAIWD